MKKNLDLPVIWDHAWTQLDCLSISGALGRPVGHSSVSLISFPITFDSEIELCSLPKQLSLVCSQWVSEALKGLRDCMMETSKKPCVTTLATSKWSQRGSESEGRPGWRRREERQVRVTS